MPLVRPCRNRFCPEYATRPGTALPTASRRSLALRLCLRVASYPSARAPARLWRCQECGAPANQVHHVIPRYLGGTYEPSNLRALCETCHVATLAASVASLWRCYAS